MPKLKSQLVRACIVISFCALAHAQNETCVDPALVDQSLSDLNYFHARWPNITVKKPRGNPYFGRQNLTYCCIQAVNDYLGNGCANNSQVQVDERALLPNVQFPCGAVWVGDSSGAPEVRVAYAWSKQNCPGWQRSEGSNINEWAQLLVSFILPAVVFSFNIPRPRKLRLWDKLLPTDIGDYRMFAGLAGALGAAITVTVDTVIWLMIAFAFAGPLLLSGLYEAQLDKRVVDFLDECIRHDQLPLALRARMLFTILCGNLDMYPAWSDTMDLARHLDELDRNSLLVSESRQPTPLIRRSSPPSLNDPSHTVSHMTHTGQTHIRLPSEIDFAETSSTKESRISFDNSIHDNRDTAPLQQQRSLDVKPRIIEQLDRPLDDAVFTRRKTIKKITVRLRAMLACQYSFGTTIGGPVVFFLGSFIYAMLQLKQSIGDEDIAEALAFGCWWMIVPHVAAVSGLLLAGNNPNILEGIVSIREDRYVIGENLTERVLERRGTITSLAGSTHETKTRINKSYSKLMEKVYEAEYEPAWMWDRGKCKQDWLLLLFTDAWLKYEIDGRTSETHIQLRHFLNRAMMLGIGDWVFLWFFAFSLVFIPCMFGFLIAYYTPEIGIACRSLTFLVYMGSQTLLLLLWTYHLTWRDRYWVLGRRINHILQGQSMAAEIASRSLTRAIEELQMQALRDTTKPDPDEHGPNGIFGFLAAYGHGRWREKKGYLAVQVLFFSLCVIGSGVSLFSSIGGSLMEIIGVYRNALCLLKVANWGPSRRSSTLLMLSANSFEQIHEAKRHWIVIGAFSVVFLGIICYIGWWYQKRLRGMFKAIAGRLDGDLKDRELRVMQRFN